MKQENKSFTIFTQDIPEAVSKICSESDVKNLFMYQAIGASETSKSLYQKSKYQGEVKH